MIKFQLRHRFPGAGDTYIAPQLIGASQPDYAWIEADNLILRYTYEFMPKGILIRFIVLTRAVLIPFHFAQGTLRGEAAPGPQIGRKIP